MRTVGIVVIAVLVGAACGAWVMHGRLQPRVDTLMAQGDQAADQLNRMQAAYEDELDQMQAEIQELEDEARGLRRKLEQVPPPQQPVPLAEETVAAIELPFLPEPEEATEPEQDRRRWGEGRRGRRRDEDLTEEERAARQVREQELRTRVRERVDGFFEAEYGGATDATVQNRLVQMEEHTNYLMDLREAMREAESDEERQQLQQGFGETAAALRDLVVEQQDYVLRTLAEEHGIKGAEQQDAFVASIREVQSSIYFQPERMIWGMGGGFGSRPRGPGFFAPPRPQPGR